MTSSAIVINADDYGISRGATLGIIKAHLEGIVTSASLTPTGLDYFQAVKLAREQCPELGVGLHFTLSAGKPVSNPGDIPDLVDDDGFFKWEFISLFRKLKLSRDDPLLDQIEFELESQIRKLKSDGIIPDHINGERHVHMIPGIFTRVLEAAKRHHIPYVRAGKDSSYRLIRAKNSRLVFFGGGIVKYLLLNGLTRINGKPIEPVRTAECFASYVFTGRLDLLLPDLLNVKNDGVTEIMVHPGIPDENLNLNLGNPGLEEYLMSEDRRLELNACIEARDIKPLAKLTTFSELATI